MKCLPVICLFLFPYYGTAQFVPDSVTYSPEKFAGYLQKNYTDPSRQLRVLYSWITSTIQYSKDSALYFNWNAGEENKIDATLRRRKGVCENFASLLADIAGRLSIPAFVVYGYPAYSHNNKDNSHSWVAIKEKEDWYLCDPTWDAQTANEKYYMLRPAEFIQTHIPFDPLWQLMENPVNYKMSTTKFMYKDSVTAFLQLDSLHQFLETERRIKNSGNKNSMSSNWQRFNQMNVAIIAGEQDMNFYNAAVESLNNANKYFNAFVQYRNQQFLPLKTDHEINKMLEPIQPLLKEAEISLKKMGKLTDNFQYDPSSIYDKIASLEKRLSEQVIFLKRYMKTIPNERIKLFYN